MKETSIHRTDVKQAGHIYVFL